MDNDGFQPLHPEFQQRIAAPIAEGSAPNEKLVKWYKDWGLILLFAFIALVIALWPSKKKDKPKEKDSSGNAPVVHIHNHGSKRVVKEKDNPPKEEKKKETPPKEEPPTKEDEKEQEEEIKEETKEETKEDKE